MTATATVPERQLGRAIRRREDRALLTGAGQYLADLPFADGLEAVFLRSPAAHAEITRLDVTVAAALPGVAAVLTAADLALPPLHPPVENPDAFSPPRPLLAEGVVRFTGEPIAIVLADSAYIGEDALELIDLELEPLPLVLDPREAGSAAPLHDGHGNVLYDHHFDSGGVDDAFAGAAIVFERDFRNPRYSATPMETRGVVAAPHGAGLRLHCSTQAPHRYATIVAELLALDPGDVTVACPDVGGGFGQKAHTYPEEVVVAAAALRTGLPVRWIEDRAENLLAASHARDQYVYVRVAADDAGRLLALDADVICDTGAYGVFPHGHILEALGTPAMLPGPYRLPHYRYRSRSIATNKAPEGAYRGVGLPVSAFVHERVMDILAAEVGIDSAEVRRRNLLGPDELPHVSLTGQRYDSGDYPRALERAIEQIGYDGVGRPEPGPDGRVRAIGLSCYVEYTGINSAVFQGRGMVGIAGYDAAHVEIGPGGRARLWTTLPAIGQGTATTFAQQLSDELDLPLDDVVVERPDTAVGGLHGTGTFASRSAISGGGAIHRAVETLLADAAERAADRLGVPAESLAYAAGAFSTATERVTLGALAAGSREGVLSASGEFDPPVPSYPYATHACEVAVDLETGAVELVRYVIVEDCGTVLNPLIVEGQVHGATTQGIGGTLYEELVYNEDGQLVTGSLMDYLVPTATEIPRFEVDHLVTPAPDQVLGAKGVGEGGTLAPPGAIANAVSAALGREFNALPLRPGNLLQSS